VVDVILDYVPTIDWSVSYEDTRVSLFETTIRYLGGLLSAYDLLKGPLSYIPQKVCSYSHVRLPRQIVNADMKRRIGSQVMSAPCSVRPQILQTT
jgi:hypothetical protein